MKQTTDGRTARKKLSAAISAALAPVLLAVMLSGCAGAAAAPDPAEAVVIVEPDRPAEPAAPAEAAVEAEAGRQNGERFEEVILLEGMEETVRYEHVRSEALGFEMDYDYERFERRSEGDRQRFVSLWDEPGNPENYLEVTYRAEDAETVAAAVREELSKDYDIRADESFPLGSAGSCIRIDASAEAGGLRMPDQLQTVYIIPAPDGCRVAAAHYSAEGAEGFGRRFGYFMNSFSVIPARGETRMTDEQALSAIRNYCFSRNPDLEGIVEAGEYPVYWEIASGEPDEIVVLFRSYTGAQIRYHIDPVSGDTGVTEFVPGISSGEEPTDERFNAWDYLD